MDMKEAFEAWWLAKVEKEIGFPLEKGMELNYGDSEIDLAWSAWSASRKFVDIDRVSDELYGTYATEVVRCVNDEWCDMLEEQGITWK